MRGALLPETALLVLIAERGVDCAPAFGNTSFIASHDRPNQVVHCPALKLGALESVPVVAGHALSIWPRPAGVAQQIGRHLAEHGELLGRNG